jgi:hypothetical protein
MDLNDLDPGSKAGVTKADKYEKVIPANGAESSQ